MARFDPIPEKDAASMTATVMAKSTPIDEKLRIIATLSFHPSREGDRDDAFQQTLLLAAHILGRRRAQQKQP